jgi:NADPH:quinone reductase
VRAAWYERQGQARQVLVVGEMPDPVPGDGEGRIALTVSGVNQGDIKKRDGWQGSPMAFPRVIPHSDGAGTIDRAGPGVDRSRVGQRAWCYGAQSYRPYGTAAQYTVVPEDLAVPLPEPGSDKETEVEEQAACLGIAGITGYRAVFADGPVTGLTVLVHGAAGGVGSIATQMARRDGATVIAVVVNDEQASKAARQGAHHVLRNDDPSLAQHIKDVAPGGVHRVADVDFASHIDLNAKVLAAGGTISSFATSQDRPGIPYWALGFKDTTLRLLGSDDFRPGVKADAARVLTKALLDGTLRSDVAARFSLDDIAAAHELMENGPPGRVVIDIPAICGVGSG